MALGFIHRRGLWTGHEIEQEKSGVGVKADLKGNREPLIFLSKGVTE